MLLYRIYQCWLAISGAMMVVFIFTLTIANALPNSLPRGQRGPRLHVFRHQHQHNYKENVKMEVVYPQVVLYNETNFLHLRVKFSTNGSKVVLDLRRNLILNGKERLDSFTENCQFVSLHSMAAFSLCEGMMGAFEWNERDYLLQPLYPRSLHGNFRNLSFEHVLTWKEALNKPFSTSESGIRKIKLKKHNLCATARSKKAFEHDSLKNVLNLDRNHVSIRWLKKENDSQLDNSVRGYLRWSKLKVPTFSSKSYSTEVNDVAYLKEDHIDEIFIEVLALIDQSMQNEHKKGIYNYILSLFGIAAGMLRHPSIGTAVTLTVVDYHFLTTEDEKKIFGNEKLRDINYILDDLNAWLWRKRRLNNAEGWDIAVLVSKRQLYSIKPILEPILGITTIKAMCYERSNGVIVFDNGLQAGFTIAHEIGHALDMAHDTVENYRETQSSVMNGVLAPNGLPWHWSERSQMFLTKFLNSDSADCLKRRIIKHNVRISVNNDEKIGDSALFYNQLMVTNKLNSESNFLSGRRYSIDEQCQLLFGPGAVRCSSDKMKYLFVNSENDNCSQLYCKVPTYGLDEGAWDCHTYGTVWAPGTPCDVGKECVRGKCEAVKSREPVHGQWSPWTKWSSCSSHCGGGVRWSSRTCTDPFPSEGGRFCVGPTHRYQSCNTQACQHGISTRDAQCQELAAKWKLNKPLKARFQAEDERPCELTCVLKNNTDLNSRPIVKDGTPCYPNGVNTGVCVRGYCRNAGCDNILGSKKQFDKCGICDGDGTTCYRVEGTIQQFWRKFKKIIFFPKYAYNISVKTVNHSGNNFFLAISDENGNYLLHGRLVRREFRPDKEVRQMLAGAWMIYKGAALRGEEESLQLIGRINQNIYIDIWPKRWEHETATMQMIYSFMTPNPYRWNRNTEVWSDCNNTCQGYSFSEAVCINLESYTLVNNSFCRYATRPAARTRKCNLHCRLEWFEDRELCNVRCGIGGRWMYRTCHLVHIHDKQKAVSLVGLPQPQEVCLRELGATTLKVWEKCKGSCHSVAWVYGNWSTCSASCGHGYRDRKYFCVDDQLRAWPEKECDDISIPTFLESCKVPCWIPSDWSACSVTCGTGQRFRNVACLIPQSSIKNFPEEQVEELRPDSECRNQPRPLQKEICSIPICAHWYAQSWSSCSKSCGDESWRYRTVLCLPLQVNNSQEIDAPLDESICMRYAENSKPEVRQKCVLSPCPLYNWQIENWSQCSMSCGENGVQHRHVWCRELTGSTFSNVSRVSNEICLEKLGPAPTRLQECSRVACPYWRIGRWSSCTRSCGGGVQIRQVVCIAKALEHYVNNKDELPDSACPAFIVVQRKRTCNNVSCLPTWQIGLWSACSASCGNGIQFRSVKCAMNKEFIEIEECERKLGEKPHSSTNCTAPGSPFCPVWRLRNDNDSNWTPCSKSCDGGWQEKILECVYETNNQNQSWHRLPDSRCAAEATPPPPRPQRRCNLNTCKDRKTVKKNVKIKPRLTPSYIWYRSEWSVCMVPCGVGVRRRTVRCMRSSESQVVASHLCLEHTPRPAMTQVCKLKDCSGGTQWRMEPAWQPCKGVCGFQKKQRRAFCVAVRKVSNSTKLKKESQIDDDEDEKFVRLPERRCLHLSTLPPMVFQPCHTKECHQFMWHVEAWSKCLAPCGEFGVRTRKVSCTKRSSADRPNEKRIHVPLQDCMGRPAEAGELPEGKQACQSGPCAFHWAVTPWSSCASSCGISYQTRHVFCSHLVSNIRVDNKQCQGHERPSYYKTCRNFEC